MISTSNLGKHYGPTTLFSEVTLQLNPGQRYGLVGANGSGKTTFLKVLTGDEAADEGQLTFGKQLRLGFLRQDQFALDEERIVDVAMRGDAEVFSALAELDQASHAAEVDPERINELSELISRRDGYTLESRAREILLGVGIPLAQIDGPLHTLSGGYKLRVLLAQVLTGRPDVLLLDEPTNHLDILSIRWLEQFLGSYAGCAVIISHDRRFLDSVTTRILDVDYETLTDYPGNYTTFLAAKELARAQKETEIERNEKLMAEKRAFVERFRAKATKARQAQSRAKQLEKMEVQTIKRSSRQPPQFRFEQARQMGKDVLTVRGISKAYGDKQVLADVSFAVRRGERVALIGQNGIGKSTLLKILTENLRSDAGTHEWGPSAELGYFAQDHHELLSDPKLTPLEFVWSAVPQETTSAVRGQLGRMLISGDEVEKKVTSLSGGEAARVIFARLAIQRPNVLVLDEPTNHLDIEAIEALAEALARYQGTLVFVSHDRWFVSKLASRIIELTPSGYQDFPGTFEEYLARDGADHLNAEAVTLKAKADRQEARRAPLIELDPKDRKKQANRRKALPKRRDELLARIEQLEAEKKAVHLRYASPEFFVSASPAEQGSLREREATAERDLEAALAEWESVEAELAQLG